MLHGFQFLITNYNVFQIKIYFIFLKFLILLNKIGFNYKIFKKIHQFKYN